MGRVITTSIFVIVELEVPTSRPRQYEIYSSASSKVDYFDAKKFSDHTKKVFDNALYL